MRRTLVALPALLTLCLAACSRGDEKSVPEGDSEACKALMMIQTMVIAQDFLAFYEHLTPARQQSVLAAARNRIRREPQLEADLEDIPAQDYITAALPFLFGEEPPIFWDRIAAESVDGNRATFELAYPDGVTRTAVLRRDGPVWKLESLTRAQAFGLTATND